MTDDPSDRIAELLDQAFGLPYGPTRTALLEEAVRVADVAQDVDSGYYLRHDLMESATFAGRNDLLLVAFSWCLAKFDAEPERFDEHDLLWKYKWVVSNACDFPEIERAKIEGLLDDMQRRFLAGGHSLHAVWQHRIDAAVSFRDVPAAESAWQVFRSARRDPLSDCEACVASANVRFQSFAGRDDQALRAAEPLLSGRLECAEEPRKALGRVLRPLVRTGDWDRAATCHEQGYRDLRRAPHEAEEFGQHLEYVVLAGDLARGRRMLEKHLPAALASVAALPRFVFFQAARLLLERLRAEGKDALKVRLPEPVAALDGRTTDLDWPAPDAKERRNLAELGDWFARGAAAIADRFDRRNGNDGFRRELDDLPRRLELARPVP
jgi:hypothetical protein